MGARRIAAVVSLLSCLSSGLADASELTPIGLRVLAAPIPVEGSDGLLHLVYEIEVTNFTPEVAALRALDVLDASRASVAATIDAQALAGRLTVNDPKATPGTLGVAQAGVLYMHLTFPTRGAIPRVIDHRLSLDLGGKPVTETAGRTDVSPPTTLVIDPPLRGERYIAGDGCCDAPRHIRASLPVDGRRIGAQRFAIDWERLDEQGRIHVGDPKLPASYVIYGQPVYAVADGRVVTAVDGLPDSPPGDLPPGLPFAQGDGNHVVQAIGNGHFALYAHLQPKSIRVRKGERVRRGQVLGLVGTSGNSSEPHLHFHVTDGPDPLASNGAPYLVRRFRSTARGESTAAFDRAIADGRPIARVPLPGPSLRQNVLPMDLWIVDWLP